jgi:hypothetical protein
MKLTISVLLLAALAAAQLTGKPQSPGKRAPRLGFVQTEDAVPITDTDMFDQQKYVEASQSDRATVEAKARRASHEAALTREFMGAFNQAKECDGIIFLENGDKKSDFALQIMVDSHDTPGQQPEWVWVLRDVGKNKLMPVGNEDSGAQAARSLCLAVWKAADPDHLKN